MSTTKTYDEIMTAAAKASLTDNQHIRQAVVNDIADYFSQHAPRLNDDPNDTGDMTPGQVDAMDTAADNILKGIHVVYQSPLNAALDANKILRDIEEGANNALKSATEGATKGIGSTALKIAAGIAAVLIAWWTVQAFAKKGAA
jgi:uncharacterized protein HemX